MELMWQILSEYDHSFIGHVYGSKDATSAVESWVDTFPSYRPSEVYAEYVEYPDSLD
jgi:hypothetical protein